MLSETTEAHQTAHKTYKVYYTTKQVLPILKCQFRTSLNRPVEITIQITVHHTVHQ